MSDVAKVQTAPTCDICVHVFGSIDPATAKYDLRTITGQWAFVCEEHRGTHAMSQQLGTGKGQRLLLEKCGHAPHNQAQCNERSCDNWFGRRSKS